MPPMTPTSPGWYPDPQGTGGERWFDGTNWSTDNVRPAQTPQTPPPPPAGYGQAPVSPQYGDAYGQPAPGQYSAPPPPPVAAYNPQAPSASNTLSIIGIVCGVIALFFCPPLFGIGGIVLGVVGKRKGERLGTVAIIVGAVGLVLGMIIGTVLLLAARN